MRLDRELQKSILERLAACYPERDRQSFFSDDSNEKQKQIANLLYLQEHGLVDSGLDQDLNGNYATIGARITAAGLDFLAEDGGLSAILRTVTVKLHADTIRTLLQARIEQANIPPEEKSRLTEQLKAIPLDVLEVAIKSLVERGIDSLPNVVAWLRSIFNVSP